MSGCAWSVLLSPSSNMLGQSSVARMGAKSSRTWRFHDRCLITSHHYSPMCPAHVVRKSEKDAPPSPIRPYNIVPLHSSIDCATISRRSHAARRELFLHRVQMRRQRVERCHFGPGLALLSLSSWPCPFRPVSPLTQVCSLKNQ